MSNIIRIIKIYDESFRANVYSEEPFRMVGFIDVSIEYTYGMERVTLAYFRSSGTKSGKIRGLWYPIAGIKINDGKFTEFSSYINHVLNRTTRNGQAKRGWLAKSLFFYKDDDLNEKIRGFSGGILHDSLLEIGKTLRDLYENKKFILDDKIEPEYLNNTLTDKVVYDGNKHTQRQNFEKFIEDIYKA